jgi:uncharacterized protein (UPF0261 family)
MSIVIVGMLDEREQALKLIKERIEHRGHKALLIDIAVGNGAIVPVLKPDVTSRELVELAHRTAEASGKPLGKNDSVTSVVGKGLLAKIGALHAAGEIQGIIAITGMTGALITLPAMQSLPFGIPKLLISGATAVPIHANKFGGFFSVSDITVMHSVVDTVGMNALVRRLCINGANAIAGMVEGEPAASETEKPSLALTEFGFCDKGAHYIRELLEDQYEIVSIHATGFGDKAAIQLVPQGVFQAFVDLVPGAFSEELLGGNRSAGPDRLDLAMRMAMPYIFCPGGFDMISCGPLERRDRNDSLWTTRKLAERKLVIQDPPRVQARTSAEEMHYVAIQAAEKLNRYDLKQRVKVVLPRAGFSSLSVEGGALHDPAADSAFIDTLRARLDPAIEVTEVESDINSPQFARAVADALARASRPERPDGIKAAPVNAANRRTTAG